MNPEDEQEFIRSALEDPRADLPPELVQDLTQEERAMYQRHRILDTNLRSGLKDLTAPMEARASSEEAFKARLLAGIKKEPEPAGLFWLRLRIKDLLEKLREVFWYEPGPVYRWTPALIILLVLPIVPLMLNEQSSRETAAHDSAPRLAEKDRNTKQIAAAKDTASGGKVTLNSKGKSPAERKAYADGLKKSARAKPGVLAFKPARSPVKRDVEKPADAKTEFAAKTTTRARTAAEPTAGAPAPAPAPAKVARADDSRRGVSKEEKRSFSIFKSRRAKKRSADAPPVRQAAPKKAEPAKAQPEKNKPALSREQELLNRLAKASSPAEKRKVLKELEQLYRAKSAVEKLRRIREKLKTFK